jgi:hypothetical protein
MPTVGFREIGLVALAPAGERAGGDAAYRGEKRGGDVGEGGLLQADSQGRIEFGRRGERIRREGRSYAFFVY